MRQAARATLDVGIGGGIAIDIGRDSASSAMISGADTGCDPDSDTDPE